MRFIVNRTEVSFGLSGNIRNAIRTQRNALSSHTLSPAG